jgi:hypothetical protein
MASRRSLKTAAENPAKPRLIGGRLEKNSTNPTRERPISNVSLRTQVARTRALSTFPEI